MTIRAIVLICIFAVMTLFVATSGWLTARGMAQLPESLASGIQMELLNESSENFIGSARQFCSVYEMLPESTRSGKVSDYMAPFTVGDGFSHFLYFDGTGTPLGSEPLGETLAPLATPRALAAFFEAAKSRDVTELTADNYTDYLSGAAVEPAIVHLRAYPEANLILGMGRVQLGTDLRLESLLATTEAARATLMRKEAGLYFCLILVALTLIWLILQHLFFLPLRKTMQRAGTPSGALTWPRFKEHASRIEALSDEKKALREKLEREIEARFQAEEERDALRNTMDRFRKSCKEELATETSQRLREWQAALMRREARVLERHFRAPLESVLEQLPSDATTEPLRNALARCIATASALGGGDDNLPFTPQSVSLQPWLEGVATRFGTAHAIPVSTSICNGTQLQIDPDALQSALEYVMENAASAAPEGSGISVDAVKTKDGVEIRIIDYGHGIDSEARPFIDVPFFTLNDEAEGLGLAVTRAVVARHGGSISLQSESEKGTAVIIHLPTNPPVQIPDQKST